MLLMLFMSNLNIILRSLNIIHMSRVSTTNCIRMQNYEAAQQSLINFQYFSSFISFIATISDTVSTFKHVMSGRTAPCFMFCSRFMTKLVHDDGTIVPYPASAACSNTCDTRYRPHQPSIHTGQYATRKNNVCVVWF